MKTTSHGAQMNKTVCRSRSRHGALEPEIAVGFAKGTKPRVASAAMHQLAAEVELATPDGANWLVRSELFYEEAGRVYLELVEATDAEAEHGMAVLRQVVG